MKMGKITESERTWVIKMTLWILSITFIIEGIKQIAYRNIPILSNPITNIIIGILILVFVLWKFDF